ncbi:PTS IIA-like nitrogen regulatory protein PtsN [Candidatus Erwinia haradaeae]|uniref:Nitrogen regulatory protein n=1 Tax=Candidatus Erwinia haradaeae TaxID=1922217 RepID=A0A451D3R9_9GAMM|nr:PTS IIA-like nitrogen regulatory protein PtsN [Candidatus Erwinia haradaeae]VFP80298.1 Nitrogen regulatory protein [Candidatus Erwinia haradaeae]
MINNHKKLELNEVLSISCIRHDIHCHSKKRVLEIISELTATQMNLPKKIIFDAIQAREKMGSTGIGNGIAIPHGTLDNNTLQTVGAFIRLENPIVFDAIDNQPVDLVFALLVSTDKCKTHLHTLSVVAKTLGNKKILTRLRSARSNEDLYKIITEKHHII